MTREQRISEIMDELSCCRDVAEQMFLDEICDKYGTDNVDVALQMFLDDEEQIAENNAPLNLEVTA